jgi:hypothetical protein
LVVMVALVPAAAFVLMPQAVHGQAVPAGGQASTPIRNSLGQPDLQGIWQVVNTAAWDLEDHRPALNIPGGYGVVEGGRIPYQPSALEQKRQNFENRATADPESKCFMPGVPRITYMPYPFQILQFPDYVAIIYEYLSLTRFLYFKGEHPDPETTTYYMGDSRARWEGNTLVVDVANFNDQTWFDRAGNFHTTELRVVERYTRTGPNHMLYEAIIEDPGVFTRPWKISMPVYRRQERNLRLLEYECYMYMEEEAGKGKLKLPWSTLEFEGIPR